MKALLLHNSGSSKTVVAPSVFLRRVISSRYGASRLLLLAFSVAISFIISVGGAEGQSTDDHGNYLDTATTLSLGSSAGGRIETGDDWDIFKLDLSGRSGSTDVWIYTTGDFDSLGALYNSAGSPLVVSDNGWIEPGLTNFHIRKVLSPGIYYVGVFSADDTSTGDYTLHADAVADPGGTISTATTLSLDTPTPGKIGSDSDADYFRMDFNESTDLVLYAQTQIQRPYLFGDPLPVPLGHIDVQAFDSRGVGISVNAGGVTLNGLRVFTRISDRFGPGTYYFKIVSETTPYTVHAYEDTEYTEFIDDCESAARPSGIADPLYGCQWHLNNPDGEDINVEAVWSEGINGEGVNVAVVDDGMYHSHEDLAANVDTSLNHDYTGGDDIYHQYDHHGTNVAGVIAARDNSIGVRGVAPRATIYGYNLIVDDGALFTAANEADAMSRRRDVTAVSNNSWGPPDGPGIDRASSVWEEAIEAGVTNGYGGRGVFYAWAGGNGHLEGDYSNLDELANFYGVTAVCAVNDGDVRSSYSEKGPNLWVCAPSNDRREDHRAIITVENSDRYYDEFGGTSAATPMVSGVAALMRSANPDLTWRDLKLIIAASARKNDVHNLGWKEGARKYGSDSDSDRYHFNHEYGFGVVDAASAVDLAGDWNNVPTLQSVSESSASATTIPAPGSNGSETVTTKLSLNTEIQFIEFVEISTSFQHTSFRDMEIELVSPAGAVSKLTVAFDTRTDDDPSISYVPLQGDFRFGSARHLGENPNGEWILRLTDHFPTPGGTLASWTLRVYGHTQAVTVPGSATGLTATANGQTQIDLSWSAPSDNGGAAIIGYRIEVSEDNVNWRELVLSTGSTATSYSDVGLAAGTTRYYRVSAINSGGTGPASNVANATTDAAAPAPTIVSVTAGEASLTVLWNAPSDTGGSTITAYDLRHIRSDADKTVDSNWTVVEDVWTGSGNLQYTVTGLNGGIEYDIQVRAVNATGDGSWSATSSGTPTATGVSQVELDPNPADVDFVDAWQLFAVTGSNLENVEIRLNTPGSVGALIYSLDEVRPEVVDACPGDEETTELTFTVALGQEFALAGCREGAVTIELRDPADGSVLEEYQATVGGIVEMVPTDGLGTPDMVSASYSEETGMVEVSWVVAANASGYIIIAINVNDISGDVVAVPLNDGDLNTQNLGGLTAGQTYDVYVAATGSGGRFMLSDAAQVTVR